MNKDLYKEIDSCVKELLKNGLISENKENSKLRTESISFLKENNLLKPAKSRFQYHPSAEIYEIKKVGIEKYIKNKDKVNWFNEPWVGYLIAFITLLFVVYQGFQNESLKKDISSSKLRVDSLRDKVLSHKKKIHSLNVGYDLFESKLSDLKNNIDKKK